MLYDDEAFTSCPLRMFPYDHAPCGIVVLLRFRAAVVPYTHVARWLSERFSRWPQTIDQQPHTARPDTLTWNLNANLVITQHTSMGRGKKQFLLLPGARYTDMSGARASIFHSNHCKLPFRCCAEKKATTLVTRLPRGYSRLWVKSACL